MRNTSSPKIHKWPFFACDALLVWTACFIYIQSKLPMGAVELALAVGCMALGALLAVTPFVLEYRAVTKLAEAQAITSVVNSIKELEKIAAQISGATGRWQTVQDEADKTVNASRNIAEKLATEAKAFTDFMQRVNDTEKATLRLEVEKMRRGETDWLQALVRMLDHTYALHSGAVRSGQPNLIEQLTQFQNACREAARRVGLVAFQAEPAETFDGQRHQLLEGDGKAPADSKVAETVATGYTFQGRLVRPALVRLQQNGSGHNTKSSLTKLPEQNQASPEPRQNH